jgi:phosphopantothenoylcysteine decarboxylase/phosphopantothenate--cysteine ligase
VRKILLGVTGSIAAYKACELVRMWVSAGDSVSVVMTKAAKEFVTPLSFQTLSRNPVFSDQFAPPVSWKPEHISLAESADLVVVAPATANIIAKIRYGIADDLLSSVLLATRAPIVVAPAMNDGMWESPVTQDNIAALEKRGITVIGPENGELACGTRGKGRMMDPQKIFEALK